MTSSWRPNALCAYSATQSNTSFSTAPTARLDDYSHAQYLVFRDPDIGEFASALDFGGHSIAGRAQLTAKANLLDVLRERTRPDAHQMAEAREAIARLRSRADEDIDTWAEGLAKSSMELKS